MVRRDTVHGCAEDPPLSTAILFTIFDSVMMDFLLADQRFFRD